MPARTFAVGHAAARSVQRPRSLGHLQYALLPIPCQGHPCCDSWRGSRDRIARAMGTCVVSRAWRRTGARPAPVGRGLRPAPGSRVDASVPEAPAVPGAPRLRDSPPSALVSPCKTRSPTPATRQPSAGPMPRVRAGGWGFCGAAPKRFILSLRSGAGTSSSIEELKSVPISLASVPPLGIGAGGRGCVGAAVGARAREAALGERIRTEGPVACQV